jgi:hypothetical protein
VSGGWEKIFLLVTSPVAGTSRVNVRKGQATQKSYRSSWPLLMRFEGLLSGEKRSVPVPEDQKVGRMKNDA